MSTNIYIYIIKSSEYLDYDYVSIGDLAPEYPDFENIDDIAITTTTTTATTRQTTADLIPFTTMGTSTSVTDSIGVQVSGFKI